MTPGWTTKGKGGAGPLTEEQQDTGVGSLKVLAARFPGTPAPAAIANHDGNERKGVPEKNRPNPQDRAPRKVFLHGQTQPHGGAVPHPALVGLGDAALV